MATLTVRTIPDDVTRSKTKLRRPAEPESGIHCLEQVVLLPRAIRMGLKEARALRKLFKGPPVSDKLLSRLKREGRL
jgi:hypothetical protein